MASKKQPLVSIVMAMYNAEDVVAETLESIFSQTYTNWELIIIDDCSKDNSLKVAKETCKNKSNIKIIELKNNSGAAVARNKGIEEANGKYIAFIDSDDMWMRKKLTEQINFMEKSNVDISYTNYTRTNCENSKIIGFVTPPEEISYKGLLKTNVIALSSAVENVDKLGKQYFPNYRKRQDWLYWLMLLEKGFKAKNASAKTLMRYRVCSKSLSANKVETALLQYKIYRETLKLPAIKSLYLFICYAMAGIRKRI